MGMNQDTPYFSILFPAYNAQDTVARALDSVLAQDFDDWELIAVDDGSTDGTREILDGYAQRDGRIRVIAQKNAGCAGARARAQREATGLFLMKFDADDVMDIHLLEAMHDCVKMHPSFDLYSCNGLLTTYDDDGRILSERPYVSSPRFKGEVSLTLSDIMNEPYILGGGSVVSRGLIEKMGGYRSGFRAEDFDLWVRAFLAGAHHFYTPQMLYRYTQGLDAQMNTDQKLSYASFVACIDDALAHTAYLSPEDKLTLEKGRMHYMQRTNLEYYELSTVNEELAFQSARFYNLLQKLFPAPLAKAFYNIAYYFKKPIDPLRIAYARKKEERKSHE